MFGGGGGGGGGGGLTWRYVLYRASSGEVARRPMMSANGLLLVMRKWITEIW